MKLLLKDISRLIGKKISRPTKVDVIGETDRKKWQSMKMILLTRVEMININSQWNFIKQI
jgi:hypothetical protein